MTRSLARLRTCGVAQCASFRETGCEMEFSCECGVRLHPTQDSQREEVRHRGGRLVTGIFTGDGHFYHSFHWINAQVGANFEWHTNTTHKP